MRLEWLEDLLAVAEAGSLGEAAERRHLTQSAFSRRIRSIEDYVGVELFDRSRKPVQLRRTTVEQHDQIQQIARTLRQLVADLRRGDRGAKNRIVLASQHALTTSRTPGLVQRVQSRLGEVRFRLRSANLDECFGLLFARQADIALVYRLAGDEQPIEADYLETLEVGAERMVPVGSAASGWEGWLAAGELPVIAYPEEVFFGKVMNRAILPRFRELAHAVPKVETALTLAALELARVGIGVAWVPASLVRDQVASGKMVDLSDRLPSCTLAVTAARLVRQVSPVEAAVWEELGRKD